MDHRNRIATPALSALLLGLPLAAQVQWATPESAVNPVAVNSAAKRLCRVVSGANTYAGTIINEPFCSYIANGSPQTTSSGYSVGVGLGKWEASGLASPSELGQQNGLPTRVCRAKVDGVFYAGHTSPTVPTTCQIAAPSGFTSLAVYEQLYDFTTPGEFQIRNQQHCLSARSGQTPAVQVRNCSDQPGDQWRIQTAAGGFLRLESVAQPGQCLHRDAANNATLLACASASTLRQTWFTDTAYRLTDVSTDLVLGRATGLTSAAPLLFRSATGTPAEAFEMLTLAEASRRLSVLTYNIMMLPILAFPQLAQQPRAEMIPPTLDRLGLLADVIAFQEGFERSARNRVLSGLLSQGYSWYTGVPDHSPETYDAVDFLSNVITNGGTFLASRWPIERIAFHKFNAKSDDPLTDVTGADRLAAKGVAYARIHKLGRKYHIFTTHLQAGPPWDEAAVRQSQLREMKTFADLQLAGAGPGDGVIFTGDFNIDMEIDVGNYQFLTDTLEADFVDAPRPVGRSLSSPVRWTVDPTDNSITQKRGASHEWLDYIFIARRSSRVTRADYHVYQPKFTSFFIMDIGNIGVLPWSPDPFATTDLSDHGALLGNFVFAPAAGAVAPSDLVSVEFRTLQSNEPIPDGQVLIDGGSLSTPATIPMERNRPVALTAYPTLAGPEGYRYRFDHWESTTAPSHTYTPTANDRKTASYVRQTQTKANIIPPDAGSVTGVGFYDEGAEFILTAVPKPGFAFQTFGRPLEANQNGVRAKASFAPQSFDAFFVPTGAPRLSLVTAGPRTYSPDGSTVRVPLRMSNNGPGGAVNARIIAVRNIVVTSGNGTVQSPGTVIPGFGTIPTGSLSATASDVPLLWPATATRIRAEFILAADGGYQTSVFLNLTR